jgi:hypothetical protein
LFFHESYLLLILLKISLFLFANITYYIMLQVIFVFWLLIPFEKGKQYCIFIVQHVYILKSKLIFISTYLLFLLINLISKIFVYLDFISYQFFRTLKILFKNIKITF